MTMHAEYAAGDHPLLELAMLITPPDRDLMQALCTAPLAEALAEPIAAGYIRLDPAGWSIPDAVRTQVEAALQHSPASIHDHYLRLIKALRERLEHAAAADQRAAREHREQQLVAYFKTTAELLIRQDPTRLGELVALVPAALLLQAEHRHWWSYYHGLGFGLRDEYAEALAILGPLTDQPAVLPLIRARALNSAATFARYSGDYELALRSYQASYALWEQLGDRVRQAYVLLNEGSLHYHLQSYEQANACLSASLAAFEAEQLEYLQALTLINLGLLARDQGQWELALERFDRAASMLEAQGALDFLGRVANNIGEVELLRGRYAEATRWFEQALTQMTTRVYWIDAYLNLGLTHHTQAEYAAALSDYQHALELVEELGRQEIAALVLYRIGQVWQAQGALDAAFAHYQRAIAAVEASRAPMHDVSLQMSLLGRWQAIYEAMVRLCLLRGDAAAAFHYAERARARAFADLLLRQSQAVPSDTAAPVELNELQAALPADTLVIAFMTLGSYGPDAGLLAALPPSADQLRAILAHPAELWAFGVTRSELRTQRCGLNPNLLVATSAYQRDGRRFLRPAVLQRIDKDLLQPFTDQWRGCSNLVLVPHGELHHIPWSAVGAGGEPLLERAVMLSTVPSATVLLHLLQRVPSAYAHACLVLGYNNPAQNLRHTEAEAATVATLTAGVLWPSAPGCAQRLLTEAEDYRWIHLACHGEFNLDAPLESWLAVGPGERLSAADILAHGRFPAELVTLSACQSGVSQILRGDEPMGLVRAFLGTGARAVLVTLWPVEDVSARLMMETFYTQLQAQTIPNLPAALQHAQRTLRAITVAEVQARIPGWNPQELGLPDDPAACPFADPSFWAAYVLVGGALTSTLS